MRTIVCLAPFKQNLRQAGGLGCRLAIQIKEMHESRNLPIHFEEPHKKAATLYAAAFFKKTGGFSISIAAMEDFKHDPAKKIRRWQRRRKRENFSGRLLNLSKMRNLGKSSSEFAHPAHGIKTLPFAAMTRASSLPCPSHPRMKKHLRPAALDFLLLS